MRDYYMINQSGEKSSDYFLYFEKYPSIEHGQEKVKEESIPGKGNVHIRTGTYEDTVIKLKLDLNTVESADSWDNAYVKAYQFLKNVKEMRFCNSEDVFYKVRAVDIGASARYSDSGGDFEVIMKCTPGVYSVLGKTEIALAGFDGMNPYVLCRPVYRIMGEGVCTLTVNGNSVTVNVAQNVTLDTERMIAYRTDGTVVNTTITGKYEDLYLMPGENNLSASPGFEVRLIPNWRKL